MQQSTWLKLAMFPNPAPAPPALPTASELSLFPTTAAPSLLAEAAHWMDPAHPRVPPEAHVLAGARTESGLSGQKFPVNCGAEPPATGAYCHLSLNGGPYGAPGFPGPSRMPAWWSSDQAAQRPLGLALHRGVALPVSLMTGWRLGREPLRLGTPSRPWLGSPEAFPCEAGTEAGSLGSGSLPVCLSRTTLLEAIGFRRRAAGAPLPVPLQCLGRAAHGYSRLFAPLLSGQQRAEPGLWRAELVSWTCMKRIFKSCPVRTSLLAQAPWAFLRLT